MLTYVKCVHAQMVTPTHLLSPQSDVHRVSKVAKAVTAKHAERKGCKGSDGQACRKERLQRQ